MKMEILFRRLRRSMGIGRPSVVDLAAPAIGILAFGIATGAAMMMLLSPASAKEARERAGRKLSGVKSRLLTLPEEMGITGTNAAVHHHTS
jgi:hypothetical protein